MKMSKAVATFCELLGPGELVVSANGAISRELYAAGDREGNFYMLGSMGQASSIALGVVLSQPGRRVIALDGDGSLIMNLGIAGECGEGDVHLVVERILSIHFQPVRSYGE